MKRRGPRKLFVKRIGLVLVALFTALSATSSCGTKNSDTGNTELAVFAAASLTEAFTEIASAFEEDHKGTKVLLNFAGSQSLRTQIQSGAQPGVFASANPKHVDILVSEGLVSSPIIFAENSLVLAVTEAVSKKVTTFKDLANVEKVVLATREVPAGSYADKVLQKAAASYGEDFATAVNKHVVSRENHVRQTLQKVVLGEADAAVVYATDAMAMNGKVVAIDIPDEFNITAQYPVALLRNSQQKKLGQDFIKFLSSEIARNILLEHGFSVPVLPTTAS